MQLHTLVYLPIVAPWNSSSCPSSSLVYYPMRGPPLAPTACLPPLGRSWLRHRRESNPRVPRLAAGRCHLSGDHHCRLVRPRQVKLEKFSRSLALSLPPSIPPPCLIHDGGQSWRTDAGVRRNSWLSGQAAAAVATDLGPRQ